MYVLMYVHVYIHAWTYTNTYVCIMSMYMCMYVCMYMYTYMYVLNIHRHTWISVFTGVSSSELFSSRGWPLCGRILAQQFWNASIIKPATHISEHYNTNCIHISIYFDTRTSSHQHTCTCPHITLAICIQFTYFL